jgi:hypothetical protein
LRHAQDSASVHEVPAIIRPKATNCNSQSRVRQNAPAQPSLDFAKADIFVCNSQSSIGRGAELPARRVVSLCMIYNDRCPHVRVSFGVGYIGNCKGRGRILD